MAAPTSPTRPWPAYGALACGVAVFLGLPERQVDPMEWMPQEGRSA